MFNDYIAQMCNKRMKTMYCASGIEVRLRDGGTSEAHGAAALAVFKRLTTYRLPHMFSRVFIK